MPLKAVSPLPVYQTSAIDGNTAFLKIPWYPSAQTEWCWAACAQMIAAFFQQTVTDQCTFAKLLFPDADCCNDPASCNSDVGIDKIKGLFNAFGKTSRFVPSTVPWEDLRTEILASRPVQVGLSWTGPGNHVAVVCGVSEDAVGPLVYVNDPDPGIAYGWVYYSNLELAYGHGSWQWSWVGIQ